MTSHAENVIEEAENYTSSEFIVNEEPPSNLGSPVKEYPKDVKAQIEEIAASNMSKDLTEQLDEELVMMVTENQEDS